jgi:hypothetical protein
MPTKWFGMARNTAQNECFTPALPDAALRRHHELAEFRK